jgi:hypothetical protein
VKYLVVVLERSAELCLPHGHKLVAVVYFLVALTQVALSAGVHVLRSLTLVLLTAAGQSEASTEKPTIGWLGLGIMGTAMTRNLLKAG